MFYSRSTGGFYNPDVHGTAMPGDVVEISAQDHQALILAQGQGLCIVPDANGFPVAVAPSLDTADLWTIIRAQRDARLRACDFTQLPDAPLSLEERAAWAVYRQALRDLPGLYADDPASLVWPNPPGSDTAPDA